MIRNLAIVLIALVGCQRAKEDVPATGSGSSGAPQAERGFARAPAGTERGDCRPDHTCDTGLLCLSDLCVAPPAADCAALAESLASAELGNYAPRDKRTAAVAEKKAMCEKLRVTKDEEKCMDTARDKWAQAKCVPRMFPDLAPGKGAAADCELIVGKMSAMIGKQMGQSTDPQVQRMIAMATNAVRASCLEDGWPDALRACILQVDPNATADAMRQCENLMPPGLQEKMQKRMATAMGGGM